MPVLKSICIAITTYSVLPAPHCEWTEENLRAAICALPVIGVFIGALLLLWQYISAALGLNPLLFAAVATVIPLLITGGIHMDGFCDTVDALASRMPRRQKLEILKDAHVGAFAVIYCAVYLLLCLGIYAELYGTVALYTVSAGFVFSRALTAFTAVNIKNAREDGMLMSFTRPVHKKIAGRITILTAVIAGAFMTVMSLWSGIYGIAMSILWLYVYRNITLKHFDGVTGDTSGFFLQLCELAVLLGALGGIIAGRLAW
ncbi:MAG: adenosylcobinamide-GDP ribazoletransferase [Clostridiales bacterium]|nr:adenosylcobinamide-GDP ribazoletransferase [Clostridiales bacterium]